jgi:hypothetical protein
MYLRKCYHFSLQALHTGQPALPFIGVRTRSSLEQEKKAERKGRESEISARGIPADSLFFFVIGGCLCFYYHANQTRKVVKRACSAPLLVKEG